jgi:hypothetical protein
VAETGSHGSEMPEARIVVIHQSSFEITGVYGLMFLALA